ncbi:MAG: excinuclease ABC subunit B, partial [Hungatella sp.]
MLCERCKIREANIQYTEIINGVKTDHNFCAQCAKEVDFGPYSAIFDGDFPLGKLLSGLLGGEESVKKPDKLQQISCPTCKT